MARESDSERSSALGRDNRRSATRHFSAVLGPSAVPFLCFIIVCVFAGIVVFLGGPSGSVDTDCARNAEACTPPCDDCDGCDAWKDGCKQWLLSQIEAEAEEAVQAIPGQLADLMTDKISWELNRQGEDSLTSAEKDDVEDSLESALANIGNDLLGYDIFTNDPDKDEDYVPDSFSFELDLDVPLISLEIDPFNLGYDRDDAVFDLSMGNFTTDFNHGELTTTWTLGLFGGKLEVSGEWDVEFDSNSFDLDFTEVKLGFRIEF